MVTIAVVSMGEMGSGIASRLAQRGARVLTTLDGRTAASAARAKAAGVEAVGEQALIDEAEIFLSIVPPFAASSTADRFRKLIERANNKPMFIECNAIAPQTLQTIAAPFVSRALPFADGCIIGLPPREGYSPKVYLSGPMAREAETLLAHGLDVRPISDALGEASALKMAFAGVIKGVQAIGSAMAVAAARADAEKHFLTEMRETAPELYGWLVKMLPSMPAKAYRWDDEMREIALFLHPERGAVEMLTGAANFYQHVAEEHRAGPDSEIISTLNRFTKKA